MERVHHRVAFYLPQIVPGGAENNFAKLASALVRQGYEVDLLVSSLNRPFSPFLEEGVRVIQLESLVGGFRLFSLMAYLRERRPSALMCGLEGPILLGCFAKILGLSGGTRIVASLRNRDDILILDYSNPFRRAIFKFLYSRLIRAADHVVAISGKLKTDYLVPVAKVPPEKVTVILNPVQSDLVRKRSMEPITESWFDWIQRPFLLAVGRLEPQKDYPTLLRAFLQVRKERDLQLVIIGEGRERPMLETMVREMGLEEHVFMPGFHPNPFKFMKRASVFVLSSKHEGFGNVLLEAMACGVRIVSADCPSGPSEILEDGKWGRLFPVGNPKALAAAVLECLGTGVHLDYEARLADFDFERTVGYYREALGLSPLGRKAPEGAVARTAFGARK